MLLFEEIKTREMFALKFEIDSIIIIRDAQIANMWNNKFY